MADRPMTWQDPPPAGSPRRPGYTPRPPKYGWFFDELRLHPGRWAVWPAPTPHVRATVTAIHAGRYTGAPTGDFQAVARAPRGSRGDVTVYVRYIGAAVGTFEEVG